MQALVLASVALTLPPKPPSITVVGLGPGSSASVTREAWSVLATAPRVWLRTVEHPAVADLPCANATSFDALYERAATFPEVYAQIVETLVDEAAMGSDVVYAVPGDPCSAEQTTLQLRRRAAERGIKLRVLPGVSFVEPSLAAVGADVLPATSIVDALLVAERSAPPFASSSAALICQVYSRARASEVKLCLLAAYPPAHEVALLHYGGGPDEAVERLPLSDVDRSASIGALTSLYVPALAGPARDFGALADGLARLAEAEAAAVAAAAAYGGAAGGADGDVAVLPPPDEVGALSLAALAPEGEQEDGEEEARGAEGGAFGDGAFGDGAASALGGLEEPEWERVLSAARRVQTLQAAAEEEREGAGAALEEGVAALLLEVLRQASAADEAGYIGGALDDVEASAAAPPGLAGVVARAAQLCGEEIERLQGT